MCVTAIIAGASLLASAAGTAANISANNANAKIAKWQSKERAKEIVEETELRTIAAMEQENERARVFDRSFSSSLAAIGASGLGENASFTQGMLGADLDNLDRDSRAIRLGLAVDRTSGQREIQAGRFASRVAGFNSKMSNIGAMADFAKDAMAMASAYGGTGTPKAAGGRDPIKVNLNNRYTNAAWSRAVGGQ